MSTDLRQHTLERLADAKLGKAMVLPSHMQIARITAFGQSVLFSITRPKDTIQKAHLNGKFYEPEELEIIRKSFPDGGRFVDIGANIGNHTLFVALFLSPSEIVAIEPHPKAYETLLYNLILNGVEDKVDLNWLGLGLSDEPGTGFGVDYFPMNLGGAKMVAGEGDIELVCGDDIIGDRKADYLKIDVEGMEVQVLRSLAKTIERDHPRIFIEVDDENSEEFHAWCAENKYRSIARFRRYGVNENFLILHESDRGLKKGFMEKA